MNAIAPIAKAVVGAAVAFISSLVTALGDNTISTQEWLTAGLAGLVALGAVWAIPNRTTPKT